MPEETHIRLTDKDGKTYIFCGLFRSKIDPRLHRSLKVITDCHSLEPSHGEEDMEPLDYYVEEKEHARLLKRPEKEELPTLTDDQIREKFNIQTEKELSIAKELISYMTL